MKVPLLILAGMLLLLLLLLLLPVRLHIQYEDALRVSVSLGPVCLKIYPPKPQKKEPKPKKAKSPKPKKPKKAKNKKQKPPKEKEKPSLAMIFDLIRLGLKALGDMLRPISVPKLHLSVQVGGRDAAQTALTYGEIAAGASALYPMLEKSLKLRDTDIAIDVDFSASSIRVQGETIVSACPLRYLIAVCRILFAYLRLRKQEDKRKQQKQTKQKGGNCNEQHSGSHESDHGKASGHD